MIDMHRQLNSLAAALAIVALYSCAPQPPYRPLPPSGAPSSISRAPQTPVPAPLPPPVEAARKQLPQESKIREQDIRARAPTPAPAAKQASVSEPRAPAEPLTPPLPDDSSLLAKITPGV